MSAAVGIAVPDLERPAEAAEPAGGGGFRLAHTPSTPPVEDIEAELAAGLIVRCEIGLGAGEGL